MCSHHHRNKSNVQWRGGCVKILGTGPEEGSQHSNDRGQSPINHDEKEREREVLNARDAVNGIPDLNSPMESVPLYLGGRGAG